jgi:hypothetical protein
MATITSTGAWTVLDFDPIGDPVTFDGQPGYVPPANIQGYHEKDGVNVRYATSMNFERLKNRDLPELEQFIQAMADGYSINYQAAVALLHHCFTALMQRENPRRSQSNLYAP